MTADELTCPKCQGSMRRYERSGIQIDQCRECRGVFLDRGELEHLIDADASFTPSQAGSQAPPTPDPGGFSRPPSESYGYDDRRDRDRGYDDHGYGDRGHGDRGHGDRGHGGQSRSRRRKSFLDELFG
jgi:Zn-finger nucleic acid-binding protein